MGTVERAAVRTAERIETVVAPPESLRPWITELGHIGTVHDVSEPFAHVPTAVTTIVLRSEQSGRRDALVLGPQTRASYSKADKPAACVRLRLAPGATRPLLGVSAADLADRAFRLADLPGVAADLADDLSELAPDEILPYLENTLPQRLTEDPTQRAHRTLLHSAITEIASGAPTPVHQLANTLAVSERQLRNLFTIGVGVSPKHYARIDRVRHVLANTPWAQSSTDSDDQRPSSFAEVASRNGYYDQSHMSADFRALMGVPPASFFRGHLPTATPCQAISRP
ncbi:helix-turn-helix domain-containing protein [Nocardia sp. NPDC052566]|uniref:AraC family transcriptional regulator n=1 Tax=Nocardia sp. NPDC052566 TaxID=3364330 RepID=UPI0037C56F0D